MGPGFWLPQRFSALTEFDRWFVSVGPCRIAMLIQYRRDRRQQNLIERFVCLF